MKPALMARHIALWGTSSALAQDTRQLVDDIGHGPRNTRFFMVNREEMRAVSSQALRSMLDMILSRGATRDIIALDRGN